MMNNAMKLWVEALRSGKYRQGKGSLSCDGGGNCCLGVAVRVLTPELSCDVLSGADLSSYENIQELLNLHSADGHFRVEDVNGEFNSMRNRLSLIDLNDELGWDFNQIADFIEENYEHLSN